KFRIFIFIWILIRVLFLFISLLFVFFVQISQIYSDKYKLNHILYFHPDFHI
ncbi:hypothetical protein CLOSTHATH_02080, partial [Hungatella hathewayi DSM 13479]